MRCWPKTAMATCAWWTTASPGGARRHSRPDVIHTYHLIPRVAGKANAVGAHMRRRGFRPEETVAIGDSRGDLEVASVVGRFYLVANALTKDPDVREAIPAGADVVVTEEPMTAGFYEAVVRSLTDRRG